MSTSRPGCPPLTRVNGTSVADHRDREIAQLHAALASRDLIGQAKGIIMAVRHCTADEAFATLQRISQNHNVKLHVVAAELVMAAGSR